MIVMGLSIHILKLSNLFFEQLERLDDLSERLKWNQTDV